MVKNFYLGGVRPMHDTNLCKKVPGKKVSGKKPWK